MDTHLLVISSRYPYSTQEAYLGTELRALGAYVSRITVAPLRPNFALRAQEVPPGIDVLAWPLASARVYAEAARAIASRPAPAARAIGALARSRDPGKLKNAAIVPKALALARWARRNRVTHVHGYWFSTPSTAAFIAGTIANVPWSATAHRWDIYERNALDVKARNASFIRTISARGTSDMRAQVRDGAPLRELRLGADIPEAFSPPEHARAFHLVSPAALVPVKGHADLLDALALVRSRGIAVTCTFAGTGPERDALVSRAYELHLEEAVRFAGHVAHDELLAWYRDGRVDAVVLASRADGPAMMEGLPSALIEALAFGIPAIATDSGSIGELLGDECGYLVPARSPDDLARAIAQIYLAPDEARTRAARGYARVRALHDAPTQMRVFASLVS